MKLSEISKDDYLYTRMYLKIIELAKSATSINKSDMMYMIDIFYDYNFFLCRDKIYVVKEDVKYENQNPVIDSIKLTELYKVTLFKDYPKTINDVEIKTIIKDETVSGITAEQILEWIDEPCDITKEIDAPFYEVIKYLKSYNRDSFRDNRYIFYSKQDEDICFDYDYFYAYDTKTDTEIKLYTKPQSIGYGFVELQEFPPQKLNEVFIEDNVKLSAYQKRQCKKSFLEFVNQDNEYFKTKNYWVMKLVWLAIQPILILREWSSCCVFGWKNLNFKEIKNIQVYDFPKPNEEPSFYLTDDIWGYCSTKIATLHFKSATYHFNGIYKRLYAKRKCWKLDKDSIKELMNFLNSPIDKNEEYFREIGVKTNWQRLINRYNENTTVGNELEKLPLDLPIPNYMELAE